MTQKLSQKFAEFKAAGIGELILDLRYNYGGSVSAAAALCSLIPTGISSASPFIIFKGNKNGGEVKEHSPSRLPMIRKLLILILYVQML